MQTTVYLSLRRVVADYQGKERQQPFPKEKKCVHDRPAIELLPRYHCARSWSVGMVNCFPSVFCTILEPRLGAPNLTSVRIYDVNKNFNAVRRQAISNPIEKQNKHTKWQTTTATPPGPTTSRPESL